MPIVIACPSCSTRLCAPSKMAGGKAKCPKCGSPIVIPSLVAKDPEAPPAQLLAQPKQPPSASATTKPDDCSNEGQGSAVRSLGKTFVIWLILVVLPVLIVPTFFFARYSQGKVWYAAFSSESAREARLAGDHRMHWRILDNGFAYSFWGNVMTGSLFALLIQNLFLTIVTAVFLFKMWQQVDTSIAPATPGAVVGLLFLPLFNIYWIFIAFRGLVLSLNRTMEQRGIKGRLASENLMMVCCVAILINSALSYALGRYVPALVDCNRIVRAPVYLILLAQAATIALSVCAFWSAKNAAVDIAASSHRKFSKSLQRLGLRSIADA